MELFKQKVILLTGAAGSVGQELIRQLIPLKPAEIRAVDNNETALFFLGEQYRHNSPLTIHLGDVRDARKLEDLCQGVDIVLHLAAFKHVGLSEQNPFEAVKTNVLGVRNVIQAAHRAGVERVLFTSSDKAVNPTNVMGITKLMGERLMTAANLEMGGQGPRFSSVRFGNVMGSRGSVLPLFVAQIRQGGPVTVTDANMTRFVMALPDAVHLVLKACTLSCGGEVFVTKMPVMRILDLARAMIELLGPCHGYDPEDIAIRITGIRPGEKLYEELLSEEEMGRALELQQMFVVLPSLPELAAKVRYRYADKLEFASCRRPYMSSREIPLTLEEIKQFLLTHRLLEPGLPEDSGRQWEVEVGTTPYYVLNEMATVLKA
uniref:NAD-dependent epimerase/dehydratase family protein n=1 Tax=Desulfobacca acetoxidans TaxID=60893 RepID=A0A7C5ALF9_9BACT